MDTADENRRIMDRLEALERDIGSPDFWESERATQVITAHARTLAVAIERGLTTFDGSRPARGA